MESRVSTRPNFSPRKTEFYEARSQGVPPIFHRNGPQWQNGASRNLRDIDDGGSAGLSGINAGCATAGRPAKIIKYAKTLGTERHLKSTEFGFITPPQLLSNAFTRTISRGYVAAVRPVVAQAFQPDTELRDQLAADAVFWPAVRKFRYSINLCFISFRGMMASMRP